MNLAKFRRMRAMVLALLVGSGLWLANASSVSAEQRDQWLGTDDDQSCVEFRSEKKGVLWIQLVAGRPVQYLELRSQTDELTVLVGLKDGNTYAIHRTKVYVASVASNKAQRTGSGGWNEGGFKWKLRYHGNYTGLGNRGGRPVDALDRAAQEHDIGYARSPVGGLDGRADAQLTAEAAWATVNPTNDMSPIARVKAAPASALFAIKPAIYLTKPVLGVRVSIPTGGMEKLSLYAAEECWNGGLKPGGKAVIGAAKKAGRKARRLVRNLRPW